MTQQHAPEVTAADGFLADIPDASVVIVTYNSVGFIDDCLESVALAAGSYDVEVVVVDNASIDGSADYVRSNWPMVRVISTGWNSGFSRACNAGARDATGERLLFLNGDAQLYPGALDLLIDALDAQDHAGVVAPRVLNPDGSDQQTARSFPTAAALVWGRRSPLTVRFPNSRFATRYLSGAEPEGTEPFEVDWVSGAALMIERDRFLELGGFDEKFFMYWEDADLCRRVRSQGLSVVCVPGARVAHAEGSSAAVTSKVQNRRFHRSAYVYAAKHHTRGPAIVARPVLKAVLGARSLAVTAARRRNERRANSGVVPNQAKPKELKRANTR